jgi:glycerophosphoryl diester phosphodiesterase
VPHKTEIIVHRAGGFLAPENTLSALKVGLTVNPNGIEIDVTFTKDHVPIVYHDDTLLRTTGLNRKVKSTTYQQLQTLDNGKWFSEEYKGEKIVSLGEFLRSFDSSTKLYLEIKRMDKGVNEVLRLLQEYNVISRVIVMSFHLNVILYFKKHNPQLNIMYLFSHKWRRPWFLSQHKLIDWYGLDYKLLEKNLNWIEKIHKIQRRVNVWSCNDIELAKKLINYGIDSITTDRPLEVKQLLDL